MLVNPETIKPEFLALAKEIKPHLPQVPGYVRIAAINKIRELRPGLTCKGVAFLYLALKLYATHHLI